MALLQSNSIELATLMPTFTLTDPFGVSYSSATLLGKKGLLVVFTCNHCPYAIAIWPRLLQLAQRAQKKGVATVAINPNIHPDYPEDSVDAMQKKIKRDRMTLPYLIDSTQEVARLYQAQCTPDLYLLDNSMRLFYHGRLDNNWQDDSLVSSHDLANAIDALYQGRPAPVMQHPSMGCSIKWQV